MNGKGVTVLVVGPAVSSAAPGEPQQKLCSSHIVVQELLGAQWMAKVGRKK